MEICGFYPSCWLLQIALPRIHRCVSFGGQMDAFLLTTNPGVELLGRRWCEWGALLDTSSRFPSGCVSLCSHQQLLRVLVSPYLVNTCYCQFSLHSGGGAVVSLCGFYLAIFWRLIMLKPDLKCLLANCWNFSMKCTWALRLIFCFVLLYVLVFVI